MMALRASRLDQIPKALLQQQSEPFSSMVDLSESEEVPIVLDESLQTFRDWMAVLFTCVTYSLIYFAR